jgi:flagellar protein FliL
MAEEKEKLEEGGEGQPAEQVEYELDENGNPVLDENGNPVPKKKKGKKKLIILLLLLLIIGGGAGAWFGGLIPHGKQEAAEGEEGELANKISYLEMEEFLVNLNNPGKQVSFLKMTVTLELPNLATENAVKEKMPRIRDVFQVYLRELHRNDLQGSAGIQRLREELLLRINKILDPQKVNDILFKEIIVQ